MINTVCDIGFLLLLAPPPHPPFISSFKRWVVSPLDPTTGRCGIVLPKWVDPSDNGNTQLEFGDVPNIFALKPEKLIRVEDGNGTKTTY